MVLLWFCGVSVNYCLVVINVLLFFVLIVEFLRWLRVVWMLFVCVVVWVSCSCGLWLCRFVVMFVCVMFVFWMRLKGFFVLIVLSWCVLFIRISCWMLVRLVSVIRCFLLWFEIIEVLLRISIWLLSVFFVLI